MGVELGCRTPPLRRARRTNCRTRTEQWGWPGGGRRAPASPAARAARSTPAHRGPPRPGFRARPASRSLPPEGRGPVPGPLPSAPPPPSPPGPALRLSSDSDTEELPSTTQASTAAAFLLFRLYNFKISLVFLEVVEISHFHLNFNLPYPTGKYSSGSPQSRRKYSKSNKCFNFKYISLFFFILTPRCSLNCQKNSPSLFI